MATISCYIFGSMSKPSALLDFVLRPITTFVGTFALAQVSIATLIVVRGGGIGGDVRSGPQAYETNSANRAYPLRGSEPVVN